MHNVIPHTRRVLITATALVVMAGVASLASAQAQAGARDQRPPTPATPTNVTHADPDADLQTIIDDAAPYTRIVGDLSNERTTGPITINKDGIRLERFNLTLQDGGAHAIIAIHGCKDVTVTDSRLTGQGKNDSNGWTNGITITDAHNIRVTNCDVTDVDLQGITATSNPLHGPMQKAGGPISDIVFAYNELSNIGNGDLLLAGGRGREAVRGWMIGNVCTSTTQDVMNVIDGFQHARVRDNYVEGPGVGLAIEQHSRGIEHAVKDVVVEGNMFHHTRGRANAIEFDHAAGPFRDIRITNNYFIGSKEQRKHFAIHVGDFKIRGLTIAGNAFESWRRAAVMFQGRRKKGVIIRDNVLRDVGMGFWLRDVAARITGNRIVEAQKVGIHVTARKMNLRGLRVVGNHIRGANTSIHIGREGDHTITQSLVKNNIGDGSLEVAALDSGDNLVEDNLVSQAQSSPRTSK